MHLCLLCKSKSTSFYKEEYYQCNNCCGIFRPNGKLPTLAEEQKRYDIHNNDVENEGYQQFVSPITNAVLKNHSSAEAGLDFGAGSGPVIARLLLDKGYNISLYDPIYHNNPKLLEQEYDYIFACEVIEHLHNPYEEFLRLKSILKPNGKLYCMTHLYDESITFDSWYYKNDFTHVFIYTGSTIDWVAQNCGFNSYSIDGRLIVFE